MTMAAKITARPSWREVIPIHEAANLFPLMDKEELQKLADDIRKNGLQEPIVLWAEEFDRKFQRYVLDGRNRLDAMELIDRLTVDKHGLTEINGLKWKEVYGREAVTSVLLFGRSPSKGSTQIEPAVDPLTYVISANIRRRQLAPNQIAEIMQEVEKRRPGLSTRDMAKMLNTSHSTVVRLRKQVRTPGPSGPQVTGGRTGRLQLPPDKAAKLTAALRDNPDMSNAAIANLVSVAKSTVQKARVRENKPRQKAPSKEIRSHESKLERTIKREWPKCTAEERKRIREFINRNDV
jgi:transposase